ncbi:DUF2878 domain-containing protein [Shewanella maritima]|uniref:DUF2878 domain-containing protein n=1 Tax=Shewanella maritima TaxID=2520507 RepID=UPI00373674F1
MAKFQLSQREISLQGVANAPASSGLTMVLFNAASFQLVWWLGVLYDNQYLWLSTTVIAVHVLLSKQKQVDVITLLACAIIGISIDGMLVLSGVFHFAQSPIWLMCLWCIFALSLNYSLAAFKRLPTLLQATLGGVFGALSYIAGAKFEAVSFPLDLFLTSILLFLIWSALFPVLLFISSWVSHHYIGEQNESASSGRER